MANVIKIKRKPKANGAGVPNSLVAGELAFSEADAKLYYGLDDNGVTPIEIAGSGYVLSKISENAPTKSGSGATGTWNISITGNAGTVTSGVYTGRTLTAGDGLVGGGNLSADRTFAVDSTVVRTTGNQTITGGKEFQGLLSAYSGLEASSIFYDGSVSINAIDGSVNLQVGGTNTAQVNSNGVNVTGNLIVSGSGLVANNIDNFHTAVRTNRLDQMSAPTADVSFNSRKITSLAEPTASADAATKNYVDNAITSGIATNDAMIFKGAIDCSANPNYPAADRGWTYKVSVAGKIGGASGITVEVNDTLICTTDSTATGNHATVGSNWIILQTNITDASILVTGPASATSGNFALFDGTTGKIIKDAGFAATTVGQNIVKLTNPSAISFLRINADNTITALSDTNFRTAIGVNNATLTLNVSGTGLSGSQTFTANQSGNATFTVTSNATSANTASAIVARDASGNFSAGTITASLNGNASTVTDGVYTSRSISTTNGITGGGNLSADRTLQLATAYGDTVNPYGSKTQNTVLAAPTGANGVPSFRSLVANDMSDFSTAAVSAVTWTTITGKPSSFTPSNHTHFTSAIFDGTSGDDNQLSFLDPLIMAVSSGYFPALLQSLASSGNWADARQYVLGVPSINGENATGTWNISITGNAGSVTNGVYTNRNITITGTTNQITSSAGAQNLSADRTWTLSLPQNIHTAATPTFGGLTINGSISGQAAALGTAATHIAVFSADPTGTTRAVGSRTAAQLLGDIGAAATNQTMFIGTTSVAINRSSASLSLSGVSIDGNAGTVTNGVYTTGTQTINGAKTFGNQATFGSGIVSSGTNSIQAAATASSATQFAVFTSSPASSAQSVLTRTPSQVLADIGAAAGPASATNNNFALFDGTTGKLIKDAGFASTTVGQNLVSLTNPSAVTFLKINANNTVSTESASTFRSSLGANTVGSNIFTLTNPSAISFIRINADNTVTARSASELKTDLSLNNVENTALSTWAGSTSITTLGTIASGTWSATTIAVDKGGTGQTSYTNGQLLIGNTTGNTLTKATLTQGTGVVITNGAGSITVAHNDTSLLNGLQGGNGISSITVDDFGHVTAVGTATYLTSATVCSAIADCTIDGGTF